MNERIRELARQSGALPTQDCGVPQWYIDEDEFEKFAELIVRECATLTLDHRSDDYYQGWLDYRDEIRQHFGVES
jgi:hypothetical protein